MSGQNHCTLPERRDTGRDLDERCRQIERMLRERDPREGYEWPVPGESARPDVPGEHPRR